MNFRDKVTEEDIRKVREIVESTDFFYEYEVEIAEELIIEAFEKGYESGYEFLFLEENGTCIGYVCYGEIPCTKDRYDIYWIVVENKHRGKGYGKKLIEECEKRIKNIEGKIAYIETSSQEKYSSTRNFYERCGYSKEAELFDYYGDNDNKIIYSKKI